MTDDEIERAVLGVWQDVPGAVNFGIAKPLTDRELLEPVAWMVYTLDGQSAFVTDNQTDFKPEHRALPLYTSSPKHKPLTDEQITELFHGNRDQWWRVDHHEFCSIARAIERAHGIGGDE